MQRSPASITLHFELSTMIGDFGDFQFGGDEVEKAGHRFLAVEHALVEIDVDDGRAAFHLLARDGDALVEFALQDELGELGRAGDVGALADEGEGDFGAERERFESGVLGTWGGRGQPWRGDATSRNGSAMHLICAGVLPQQPPAMLSQPWSAKSRMSGPMSSGRSGKPVGERGSGRPALG